MSWHCSVLHCMHVKHACKAIGHVFKFHFLKCTAKVWFKVCFTDHANILVLGKNKIDIYIFLVSRKPITKALNREAEPYGFFLVNALREYHYALGQHYGRWKPDPSRKSNENYSTSPRGVMGVKRSEINCRMQIHRFGAHLLTYLWVNDKNVHFLCTFLPFLAVFRECFKDYFP